MCDMNIPKIMVENNPKKEEGFYLYDIYQVEPKIKRRCLVHCGERCDCDNKLDIPVVPLYDNGTIREVPTVGTDQNTDDISDKTTDATNDEVK